MLTGKMATFPLLFYYYIVLFFLVMLPVRRYFYNKSITVWLQASCKNRPDRGSKSFSIFKFWSSQFDLNYYWIFGIKIIRNPADFLEIIILVGKLYSISTIIEYEQPYFEPWTGRFSPTLIVQCAHHTF